MDYRILNNKKYYLYIPTVKKHRITYAVVSSIVLTIGLGAFDWMCIYAFKWVGFAFALILSSIILYCYISVWFMGYFILTPDEKSLILKRPKRKDRSIDFSSVKELKFEMPEDRSERGLKFFPMMAVYNHDEDVLFYVCANPEIIELFRSHGIPCHKGDL